MEVLWVIGFVILFIFSLRFIFNPNQKRYQQLSAVYIAWAFINLVVLATSEKDSSGFSLLMAKILTNMIMVNF